MPTPAELMEGARALDTSFTEDRHPPTVLRRELDRQLRTLAADVVGWEPSAIVEEFVVELPLADFGAGAPLEVEPDPPGDPVPLDYLRINEIEAVRGPGGNERHEVRQVPVRHRFDPGFFPAVWISGNRLHLVGDPGIWRAYQEVRIRYVPAPPALEPDADGELIAYPLPGSAWRVLIDELAAYMAKRAPMEPQQRAAAFIESAGESRGSFFGELADRQGATVDRIREVW